MPPKTVDKKRSIGQYEGRCSSLIAEAENFNGANNAGLTVVGMERAKMHVADLKAQFSRMELRWENDFKAELEESDQTAHDDLENRVYETGKKIRKVVDVLFALMEKPMLSSSATPPAAVSKSHPKMDTGFKPALLPASSNLEEYNKWEKDFLSHLDLNKDFLAASSEQMKRTFFTTLLDGKIQAALDTDDTMTLDVPITSANNDTKTLLKWLRAYVLRHSPLYIRRYQYSLCKQLTKESFQDFWTRKLTKARECDLQNIDANAVQITELIIGINNPKMREECLKLKDPKLADLVAIGLQSDLAASVKKDNFGGGDAAVLKTSEYQNSKKKNWNSAKQEPQKAGNSGPHGGGIKGGNSNHPGRPGGNSERFNKNPCKVCGYADCDKRPCPKSERFCPNCGKKGHGFKVCPSGNGNAQSARADQTGKTSKTKTIRISKATAKVVQELDDCEPTPICNMHFETENGVEFTHDVLPDTGCSQTLISLDLAKSNGMVVNRKLKKNIRNASDESMCCNGTVEFEVSFQGNSTRVAALVSSDLAGGEVLLDWKALRRLRIIPEHFPSPIPKGQISKMLKLDVDQFAHLPRRDPKSNVEEAMSAFPEVFQDQSEVSGVLKAMKLRSANQFGLFVKKNCTFFGL